MTKVGQVEITSPEPYRWGSGEDGDVYWSHNGEVTFSGMDSTIRGLFNYGDGESYGSGTSGYIKFFPKLGFWAVAIDGEFENTTQYRYRASYNGTVGSDPNTRGVTTYYRYKWDGTNWCFQKVDNGIRYVAAISDALFNMAHGEYVDDAETTVTNILKLPTSVSLSDGFWGASAPSWEDSGESHGVSTSTINTYISELDSITYTYASDLHKSWRLPGGIYQFKNLFISDDVYVPVHSKNYFHQAVVIFATGQVVFGERVIMDSNPGGTNLGRKRSARTTSGIWRAGITRTSGSTYYKWSISTVTSEGQYAISCGGGGGGGGHNGYGGRGAPSNRAAFKYYKNHGLELGSDVLELGYPVPNSGTTVATKNGGGRSGRTGFGVSQAIVDKLKSEFNYSARKVHDSNGTLIDRDDFPLTCGGDGGDGAYYNYESGSYETSKKGRGGQGGGMIGIVAPKVIFPIWTNTSDNDDDNATAACLYACGQSKEVSTSGQGFTTGNKFYIIGMDEDSPIQSGQGGRLAGGDSLDDPPNAMNSRHSATGKAGKGSGAGGGGAGGLVYIIYNELTGHPTIRTYGGYGGRTLDISGSNDGAIGGAGGEGYFMLGHKSLQTGPVTWRMEGSHGMKLGKAIKVDFRGEQDLGHTSNTTDQVYWPRIEYYYPFGIDSTLTADWVQSSDSEFFTNDGDGFTTGASNTYGVTGTHRAGGYAYADDTNDAAGDWFWFHENSVDGTVHQVAVKMGSGKLPNHQDTFDLWMRPTGPLGHSYTSSGAGSDNNFYYTSDGTATGTPTPGHVLDVTYDGSDGGAVLSDYYFRMNVFQVGDWDQHAHYIYLEIPVSFPLDAVNNVVAFTVKDSQNQVWRFERGNSKDSNNEVNKYEFRYKRLYDRYGKQGLRWPYASNSHKDNGTSAITLPDVGYGVDIVQ
jgi:hypothetical protein